ncbi:MAG: hypothetical protein Q7S65_05335 [Nanoarchaeota archaeon]|nr:hypothetical protein [Nanoarchaeota archaeon]
MEHGKLLEGLFDSKRMAVLKFFIINKGKEFYLQEVVRATGVPLATCYRTVRKLFTLGLIQELKVKRFTLYRCMDSADITFLEGLVREGGRILEEFVQKVKEDPKIEEVILSGQEREDRSFVILIGQSINNTLVKSLVADIKASRGHSIVHTSLEREQYEQQLALGLYPGEKKLLFKRQA